MAPVAAIAPHRAVVRKKELRFGSQIPSVRATQAAR
ncbi:hypothetical protein CHELA1G11_21039 [Hyphomicrobiales bacterium]|nr:hypothetical protein CHELA1G11_21039 [Hyphomicrobiales bacterium]